MAASHAGSEELLRVEYQKASDFCVHVDDVRNVITSFFLTLSAGAAWVISGYASGSLKTQALGPPAFFAAAASAGVGIIGGLFVATLARLRRVQLERYRTMNAILDSCLTAEHRPLVPFSNATMAVKASPRGLRRRATGSYTWTMAIVVPTGILFGLTVLIILRSSSVHHGLSAACAIVAGTSAVLALDALYMRWSE